jgi:hypothetical protein
MKISSIFVTVSRAGSTDDNNNNFNDEWKACRKYIDKFDKLLIDLRKYGFSFVTGLMTAGSFLGFAPDLSAKTIQIGVIVLACRQKALYSLGLAIFDGSTNHPQSPPVPWTYAPITNESYSASS